MTNETKRSVVKVGGSLFKMPDLGQRLAPLIREIDGSVVIVFGGGHFVEPIRKLWNRQQIDVVQAHWQCIEAMTFSASFGYQCLRSEIPNLIRTGEFSDLVQFGQNDVSIFDCQEWLRNHDSSNESLPECWDVSSDSIAALLAMELDAHQLMLCKSVSTESGDFFELARLGVVDSYFPKIAGMFAETGQIQILNLRNRSLNDREFAD